MDNNSKITIVDFWTNLNFPRQTGTYSGKVREMRSIGESYIVAVATDRISAYNYVLPQAIPYKGAVLNLMSSYLMSSVSDIIRSWVLKTPHPNSSIGIKCEPIMVEVVLRRYICGSMWKAYKNGQRVFWGTTLPEGMKENDLLPELMITPTEKTKDDDPISAEGIVAQGLATADEWDRICNYAVRLFERGTTIALSRGLILVDTKYEFGRLGDEIVLIDEVHTPDSSRYFYANEYAERQQQGLPQKHLSKEFVREWLKENGFEGKENQVIPVMSPEFIKEVSAKYIELYETITGSKFPYDEANKETIYEKTMECFDGDMNLVLA